MERRLSAILAADMVGYSRLMGADEVGTLERQKAHRRELIDPAFQQFRGRIVKEMGDGVLVEFPSVIEAVQCAITIQDAMLKREADMAEDREIAYRIGINIGDVIVEADDIYGDGVNIAARLEGLADKGGICISHPVGAQIRGKLDLDLEDLGEKQVKNITEPVSTYRIIMNEKAEALAASIDLDRVTAPPAADRQSAKRLTAMAGMAAVLLLLVAAGGYWWWSQQSDIAPGEPATQAATEVSKPSIAVLPFENLSDSEAQDYFVDGLTEDLTTDLSKVSGLFVIARDSSFRYKNSKMELPAIAGELGVRYLLKGSVRRVSDQLRINAQLIDAKTSGNLWADRFDGVMEDVFSLQDDVTKQIVSELSVALTADEKKELGDTETVKPEAYDLFLQGRTYVRLFSPQGNVEARDYFQKAIAADPEFGRAHGGLALTYAVDLTFGWSDDPQKARTLAFDHIETALKLSPATPEIHFTRAMIYGTQRQIEKGIEELRKSVALDPNYADGHTTLGLFLAYAGRPAEAIKSIRLAMRLSPHHGYIYPYHLATAYFVMERYGEAVPILENVLERNNNFQQGRLLYISTLGLLDRIDDAEWEVEELLAALPDFSISEELKRVRYVREEDRARYGEGLRKAGLPE
jgi:adenylate cyclase